MSKPKMRTGVEFVRDFPPGCGIKPDREKLGDTKSFLGSRPAATRKVQFWDPGCSKAVKKSEEATVIMSQKEKVSREKIEEAKKMFDEVYRKLFLENRVKEKGEKIAHWRVPVEAAKMVKQALKLSDVNKTIGSICGVQVGDKFNYRSQLQMFGLHCQPQSGIDYTNIRGKNLAISIVDSNRYKNERESSDVLLYSGQGGIKFLGSKEVIPEDQKLERGNLALKNSMTEKSLVRVIRKLHGVGNDRDVFVYDGLYTVKDIIQEKGEHGKMVFKFELHRLPGQPQLNKSLK